METQPIERVWYEVWGRYALDSLLEGPLIASRGDPIQDIFGEIRFDSLTSAITEGERLEKTEHLVYWEVRECKVQSSVCWKSHNEAEIKRQVGIASLIKEANELRRNYAKDISNSLGYGV